MKRRTCAGASDLFLRNWTATLKRVWSSTSTRRYWYPVCCVRTKGPAMSVEMSLPAWVGL
eukprot:1773879-Pleurochrysis_carterae.AAC.1